MLSVFAIGFRSSAQSEWRKSMKYLHNLWRNWRYRCKYYDRKNQMWLSPHDYSPSPVHPDATLVSFDPINRKIVMTKGNSMILTEHYLGMVE